MTDRGNVIKHFEHLLNAAKGNYQDFVDLTVDAGEEIIALLKEQEAVKPVLDEQTGRIWLCGKCGSYVGFEDNDPYDTNEFDKYCRECGRPVLWEGR